MAKRKDIDATSSEPASNAPEPAQAESELPTVESPSISPATPAPVIAPIAELAPAIEPIVEAAPAAAPKIEAPATPRRFTFNARHKRNALLAASVAIAVAPRPRPPTSPAWKKPRRCSNRSPGSATKSPR